MNDRLHPFLLLLTLLDLGFVHATGSVTATALLPMWPLALVSPWLRRLQRHRWYRATWNTTVLVVFALLVHHALTAGLLHMLEDGLVLAVLCQVHLLNNIGERQRPDLTFFNSFLIAFVAVFFAPDAWWSLLFAAHTVVFVPALQVYALTRGGAAVDRTLARSLLRDSLPRIAAVGVLTALVFVFWPRDFDRRGLLEARLMFGRAGTGIAERIDITDNQRSRQDDAIALRVTPIAARSGSEQPATTPTHWRAAAFVRFDGRQWHAQDEGSFGSRFLTDPRWRSGPGGRWHRPAQTAPHTRLEVLQFDRRSERLLLPLAAVAVDPLDLRRCMLEPQSFGGFATLPPAETTRGPLHYVVALAPPRTTHALGPLAQRRLTELPRGRVPRVAFDLARRLRAELPNQAGRLAIAATFATWLQEHRRYQLPGEAGFADDFGEFLLGTSAGHCEYFATALALLLRIEDVPCRLVGGYLLHEGADGDRALVARERDAHAWVEVLAEDGSWHTVDPTPPRRSSDGAGDAIGWFGEFAAALQTLWHDVTGFDAATRRRLANYLLELPTHHPFLVLLLALAAIAAAVVIRRRRQRRSPEVDAFERAVRRAGLTRAAGETPRELLARAATLDLDEPVLTRLRRSAAEHERQRYGR